VTESIDPPAFDVVGDVHGHLGALRRLGTLLGYDPGVGWRHPEGRQLLFVGDLVDRGPDSLGTAEEVAGLAAAGRAVCLMGNHEYNLVSQVLGLADPRPSNADTMADVAARPERWDPLLRWMRTLPVAVAVPGLRVIHAEWHRACGEAVSDVLGAPSCREAAGNGSPLAPWIALGSPFVDGSLHPDLPTDGVPPGGDLPHEILMKGHERPATEPFVDADGAWRDQERACWWLDAVEDVPHDDRIVFGHYWCLPPRVGAEVFAPPYPTGHPENRSWLHRHSQDLAREGRWTVPDHERFVCVDYNGMFRHQAVGCVGAYRWPEHEVVWASEPE
jgi:hypothetical protein